MNIRKQQEQQEAIYLNKYATQSAQSKGRQVPEALCDIRTDFQRDRDRILHSKAFRRLSHKTQVFIAPEGDHYRTRLTHTLEVSQIGRSIARGLKLNEDLTEAIALGHDLGHTPFGHAGEEALDSVVEGGFRHYEQSIRVVEQLENEGKGLNLTWEVRDGILNHPTKNHPQTLEGKVIRLADKIAYINHDIDDAVRAGVLRLEDLPKEEIAVLGSDTRSRINNMIHNIIENGVEENDLYMSASMLSAMQKLRAFMFKNVYIGSKAKAHEAKAQNMIIQLYTHLKKEKELLPSKFLSQVEQGEETLDRVVCDYVAGMTDRYAINMFTTLFIPKSWKD